MLDGTLSVDRARELDILVLWGPHSNDLFGALLLGELNFLHGIETFHQVRLHSVHISRLRKDLDQIVIGEEVKAREGASLCSKVVLKALLDFFQLFVGLYELPVDGDTVSLHSNLGVLLSLAHVVLPELVHSLELLRLVLQLSLDILSIEDVFEVHPLAHESHPFIDGVTDVSELGFPLFNADDSLDLGDVARTQNGLHRHDVIFELSDHVFDLFDDVAVLGVAIGGNHEFTGLPAAFDLVHLTGQLSLTLGESSNFHNCLLMVLGAVIDHSAQIKVSEFGGRVVRLHPLEDIVPMPNVEVFAAERFDQIGVGDHFVNLTVELFEHLVLLTLLEFHFHLNVGLLVFVDFFDDCLSVLTLDRVIVPLPALNLEHVTVVPQLVAVLKLGLEDIDLGNSGMLTLEHILILLVILELIVDLVILFADFGQVFEGLLWKHICLRQEVVAKLIDLFTDLVLQL